MTEATRCIHNAYGVIDGSNPRTWPTSWRSNEIKLLFKGTPLLKPTLDGFYDALTMKFTENDYHGLERTIKEYMRAPLPKMLNVNEFLRRDGRLGNDCGLELPLQERDDVVAMLKAALWPARSSGRVNVASCSSPRPGWEGNTRQVVRFQTPS